mgnify:CR=1 FL=1
MFLINKPIKNCLELIDSQPTMIKFNGFSCSNTNNDQLTMLKNTNELNEFRIEIHIFFTYEIESLRVKNFLQKRKTSYKMLAYSTEIFDKL